MFFEPTKCTPGFVEPSLDVLLGTVVCTDHTPEISELINMFQRFSIGCVMINSTKQHNSLQTVKKKNYGVTVLRCTNMQLISVPI